MAEGWLGSKRCLIVGGGSGIGRSVCEAFLAEGARVAVLERDPAKCGAVETDLPGVVVVQGDATVVDDNERAVSSTVGAFGGLDVLVNCVGLFDFYRGLVDLDPGEIEAAFDEVYRANVLSQLLGVRAAVDQLRQNRGAVVLTVSTSGFYPGRGGVLYVSSKFAVRGLVVTLASELAPEVRVNGVAPGGTVGTDLRGPAALDQADRRLPDGPRREDELKARTPLSVALTGADHAGSYVFLASDRARGITGTFVHPDGGIAVKT